jgi:hypothetical protein
MNKKPLLMVVVALLTRVHVDRGMILKGPNATHLRPIFESRPDREYEKLACEIIGSWGEHPFEWIEPDVYPYLTEGIREFARNPPKKSRG